MSMLARPLSTISTPPANLIGKLSDGLSCGPTSDPLVKTTTRCSLLRGSSPPTHPSTVRHILMNNIETTYLLSSKWTSLHFIFQLWRPALSSFESSLSHTPLLLTRSNFLFIADTLAKSYTFTLVGFPLSLVISVAFSTFGLANFHLHFAVSGLLPFITSATKAKLPSLAPLIKKKKKFYTYLPMHYAEFQ